MGGIGPTADRLIGRTLGDFTIQDKLGEGAFGAVYRAEQSSLAREAAVKVVHTWKQQHDGIAQRFLREARLASSLDHPFAAHVYAFGLENDGLLWIAMELVRGTPLSVLIKQGTIPLARFVPFFERLCDVVHSAHEQGIVHRDIKPANVMVISRSGRLFPKLLDLGIAKLRDVASLPSPVVAGGPPPDEPAPDGDPSPREIATVVMTVPMGEVPDAPATPGRSTPEPVSGSLPRLVPDRVSGSTSDDGDPHSIPERLSHSQITPATFVTALSAELTGDGLFVGSAHYSPPEQWMDAAHVDARADIYALGCLAYRALTGRQAFDGASNVEIFAAHRNAPAPSFGSHFPPLLDSVLARALAKSPGDRFGSALELAEAFRLAANVEDDANEVPQLAEDVRETFLSLGPQPLADAVANLEATRKGEALVADARRLVRALSHYLGILALAGRARIGAQPGTEEPLAGRLGHAQLDAAEWLALAHALCLPFAERRELHPIPELVSFFCSPRSAEVSAEALALSSLVRELEGPDAESIQSPIQLIGRLSNVLRSAQFLTSYRLQIQTSDRAEQLVGVRRARRLAGSCVESVPTGHVYLVNQGHELTLDLFPLVQLQVPAPAAPEEVFLVAGMGRHGMKLVAHPGGFERHDEEAAAYLARQGLLVRASADAGEFTEESPYRGLSAFGASDAKRFFGREREAEAMANRLRVQALICVVGPSGAGKSSFVHAGVVPLLSNTRAVTVRPGPAPISALQYRLAAEGIEISDLRRELEADPSFLTATLLQHGRSKGQSLVLIVDQFEELVTLARDLDERTLYADALAHVAETNDPSLRVILTLRDDFLIRVQALPSLRERLAPGLQLLATPSGEDLLRILTEPARQAGYDFDPPGLPSEMAKSVADAPGALALLSFTAAKLWELRDRQLRRLTRKVYDSLGGVGGALAHHAEATLSGMAANEQHLVREAFRHLVTAEGTRAVMSRAEMRQVLGGTSAAERALDRLIDARLLTSSEVTQGESRVEVIHEALLSTWPRLVEWQREDAENIRMRDQLRAAARQWQDRQRARGLLWRGDVLLECRLWRTRYPGRLTDVEEGFVAASLGDESRIRWIRRAAAAGVVAVGLSVWGGFELKARRDLTVKIEQATAQAQTELDQASRVKHDLEAHEQAALAAFDQARPEQGEKLWADVHPLRRQLHARYVHAGNLLETAFTLDPARESSRAAVADLVYLRAIEAEKARQDDQVVELVGRLQLYDGGEAMARWEAPAVVDLKTVPSADTLIIERYEDAGRSRVKIEPKRAPDGGLVLPAGSYLFSITATGHLPLRYPIVLSRGEKQEIALQLPRASELPESFVYIPPGRYRRGYFGLETMRHLFNQVPEHDARTPGFLIARYETTWAEWIEYVKGTRTVGAPARFGTPTQGAQLLELADGRFELTLRVGGRLHTLKQGDKLVLEGRHVDWLRTPAAAVSFNEAEAYARWLSQTRRVPGARLCTDWEWERAARGADGRTWTNGDRLEPLDANFDQTFGKVQAAFGPTEVGSFPSSQSPFGVDDMVGNIEEWVEGSQGDGRSVGRSGSYYYDMSISAVINRATLDPDLHDAYQGLRLCADAPDARLR